MLETKTKHMFAGGNTVLGFFSYYDYIIEWEKAKEIYILKGGPGTGKSTFMKDIGYEAIKNGYDIEYFHCSSDSDSLDGVAIPKLKVAMVDGTPPHIIDPKYPGVVDKIVNLGDFLNQKELMKDKQTIVEKRKEIKKYFDRAYRYLKSAGILYEDIESFYNNALNINKVDIIAGKLIEELFSNEKTTEKEGRQRHLFASAITPKGLINYLESILTTSRVYKVITSSVKDPGTTVVEETVAPIGIGATKVIDTDIAAAATAERLITKIKDAAVERGHYVECFYCALFPQKLEHIVIPELDVSFTTVNRYHNAPVKAWETIDLSRCYNKNMLNKYLQIIKESEKQFNTLLNTAINSINKAKVFHHETERYYSGSMDFESLGLYKEKIKSEVLN
jgi:hypothetical protein